MKDVYIYAIGMIDGPIKIGFSSNLFERLHHIQAYCPFRVDLIHARRCHDRAHARNHERILHEIYSDERVIGEWFNINGTVAIEAIDISLDAESYYLREYGGSQ
jgi:predicted transcriptional regulator of viral defense system